MNEIDRLQLLAELVETSCELNHGPDTKKQSPPATDYIVIPFGYQENEVTDVCARELVVPVCYDCAQALLGSDWTLLYCFECNSSQWVYRKMAKNKYRHHILWLRGCPDCSYEFGGLYFNEISIYPKSVEFLLQQMKLSAA
ncbi:MAG: hypothetical protein KKE17_08180 [Proteobacteria bacterium]|nr:hypothetical protein [Pseudomonadota bacterium]MBU1709964.1 hypothetical protein [Pseudomonadota bacterium]